MLKAVLKATTRTLGYAIRRLPHGDTYDNDSLTVTGKFAPFLSDVRFLNAYKRGMQSGQRVHGYNIDVHIEWRVAVACWAAAHGMHLPGDLVECGVSTGMMSLAICEYVSLNACGKQFYLFDTFDGIPEDQMSERERSLRIL